MRIAVTADLHWGHGATGDQATLELVEFLRANPPDALLLGGDQGSGEHFRECLALFQDLPGTKALVPGNHDIWVTSDDPRGDSLQVYQQHIAQLCQWHGYHYLDQGPLLLDGGLSIVGTMNWYDYSWSLEKLQRERPDWEERLRRKAFTRGSHNDGRFVRWPLDDVRFTELAVSNFGRHLDDALRRTRQAIVLTHHPACYALNFPRDTPAQGWDSLLWDALCGNTALERILSENIERIPFVFSGHTHRAREETFGPTRLFNIGGDYHFKRLLVIDHPGGDVAVHTFGEPAAGR